MGDAVKARALRRLSRALDAVADRLGRLAALLEVAADSDIRVTLNVDLPPVPRVPNACQFCGAPPGKAMCHGCPGVWRGVA